MANGIVISLALFALAWGHGQAVAGEDAGTAAFAGQTFSRVADGDEWRLSFGDDGRLLVYLNGQAEAEVNYTASAGEIELVDVEGSCTGDEARGVYAWHITAGTLTMTARSDPCARRRGVLTGDAWAAAE